MHYTTNFVTTCPPVTVFLLPPHTALDGPIYNARFTESHMKHGNPGSGCETPVEAIRDKTARKAEAEDFIRELMKQPALITEFDPIAYHVLVDRMTVFKKDRVVVRFKNGVEIEV